MSDFKFAALVGGYAGVIFFIAFLFYIRANPDPQNGSAIALSPIYGCWVGVPIGMTTLGILRLRKPDASKTPAGPLLGSGLLLLMSAIAFFVSEHIEMVGG